MNEAPNQKTAAAEIARLRGDVAQYAAFLGEPAERFLNPQFISYHTGISPDRVTELLAGDALPEIEPTDKQQLEDFQRALFAQRLNFLRDTRTKTTVGGEATPYSLHDIAKATRISFQQVSFLLNGQRKANAAHADRLEKFFDEVSRQRTPPSRVPPGFCLRNEGAALISFLDQMVTSDLPRLTLRTLAEDTTSVALRAGNDTGDAMEVDLVKLLPVLARLRDEARGRRH